MIAGKGGDHNTTFEATSNAERHLFPYIYGTSSHDMKLPVARAGPIVQ